MQINVKWGIYAGVAAFVLALLTSILVGQAAFSSAFLRALCFAAIFFVLGSGAETLINTFMPELMFPEGDDATSNIFGAESGVSQNANYGSRINITLGDGTEAALPDNSEPDPDNVGNIADLVSGAVDPAAESKNELGLDDFGENSYNKVGGEAAPSMSGFAGPSPAAGDTSALAMNFDTFAMGDGIGGLETFGDSFALPPESGGGKKEADTFVPERKVIENTPKKLEGDFNPKDIAAGIRTVLENDKKG